MKCKFLRNLESKGEKTSRIDKMRAVVKDLHSRIRIAILRIDSISKRIEELRDKELTPQLEELIDGYDSIDSSCFSKALFHAIIFLLYITLYFDVGVKGAPSVKAIQSVNRNFLKKKLLQIEFLFIVTIILGLAHTTEIQFQIPIFIFHIVE